MCVNILVIASNELVNEFLILDLYLKFQFQKNPIHDLCPKIRLPLNLKIVIVKSMFSNIITSLS